MNFGTIGSWIDKKLDNASTTWKGSQAKKVVDDVVARSKTAAGDVKGQVDDVHGNIRDNVDANLTQIEKEKPNATGFEKMLEIGKRGGFIGIMAKGPQTEEAKPPVMESKPPVIEEKKPEPQQMELFPKEERPHKTLEQALKDSDAGLFVIDPEKGTTHHYGGPPPESFKSGENEPGMLKKMWDFGKQGGVVGAMKRKKEPQAFVPTNTKPVEQVDGFNIAT